LIKSDLKSINKEIAGPDNDHDLVLHKNNQEISENLHQSGTITQAYEQQILDSNEHFTQV
jgi:hypothetical protein